MFVMSQDSAVTLNTELVAIMMACDDGTIKMYTEHTDIWWTMAEYSTKEKAEFVLDLIMNLMANQPDEICKIPSERDVNDLWLYKKKKEEVGK